MSDTEALSAEPTDPAAPLLPAAPRIRWAAIVWGLLFAGIASALLWVVTDVGNRDAASVWLKTVSPATLVLVILLVVGGLLLVAGLASLLRRITSGRS